MPYPLNNYTTQDAYSSNGEVVFSPPKDSFNMIVTGAAIYYSLAASTGDRYTSGETYGLEAFLPPGRYTFDADDSTAIGGNGKLAQVKVRSAVAATPAQVTVI